MKPFRTIKIQSNNGDCSINTYFLRSFPLFFTVLLSSFKNVSTHHGSSNYKCCSHVVLSPSASLNTWCVFSAEWNLPGKPTSLTTAAAVLTGRTIPVLNDEFHQRHESSVRAGGRCDTCCPSITSYLVYFIFHTIGLLIITLQSLPVKYM